jgi:serine/threonine protein kinase
MGADAAADEQFGPYLVYERLGVGGMATVHRALERGIEGFERIVALKRLLPHLAEDASFIKSFVREAKLASLLNHHNIVQIYELGRVGTEYFISMELIAGRDIRRILRHARKTSGPPPIHVTVGLLMQLAEALDYAHTKCDEHGQPLKLIHRDISPSNLIVSPTGHLKVIDFGIAKAQSSQLRTQTGRVKGKLAYMAPEAINSAKDLDARSDLWAVGVIAHELLTARPLFANKNEYQTLIKVQRGDITPPSSFNQACPPELDAIVMKALARDPDERFADAAALREALIELRKKLKLSTGVRDIAGWLEWAFALEAPSGGFAGKTGDRSGSGSGAFDLREAAASLAGMSAHLTPAPKPRREDDDAVEIAWGGGDDESAASMPLELDDVPDVSEKHLAPRVRDPDFEPETSDDHDDIPAPEPTHGVVRPKRDTNPSQIAIALPLPAPPTTPKPELIGPPRERRSTAKGIPVRAETVDRPSGILDELPRHARSPSDLSSADSADRLPAEPRDTQPSMVASKIRTLPPPDVQPRKTPMPDPEPPVRQSLADIAADDDLLNTQPRPRRSVADQGRPVKRPSNATVSIGDNIVARESIRSRAWIWILALVVLGAGGAAYVLFATGGDGADGPARLERADDHPVVVPAAPKRATVKFIVEPADVAITVEGQSHVGSPWSIDLEPGNHKIELRRDGFKPRVSSIELSPNETMTVMVALEKMPRRVGRDMSSQATLILDSDPQGLEILLDGRLLSERTPITRTIAAGKHDIVLRQNGVEVWRQHLVAEADADHEYRPVFSEEKKRERRQRQRVVGGATRERTVESTPTPPITEAVTPTAPEPTPQATIAPPVEPAPTPAPPPPPANAVPPRVVGAPSKPAAIQNTGPVMIAPSAAKRVSGETPTLGASRPENLPPVVSAKVCIDPQGTVTSADILTKLERHTVSDLAATLRGWRYAPYKQDGVAVSACFSVNFRVK